MKPLYQQPSDWSVSPPMGDRDRVQAWQLESIRRARESGHKSLLLQAPMGSGKTVVAAKLALESEASGERVVFLCHLITLVDQAAKAFRDWGVNFQVEQGQRRAKREFGNKTFHVIALKNSLGPRRLESFLNRTGFNRLPVVVIADECHLSTSSSFLDPIKGLNPVLTLGLTGTPMRLDGKTLIGAGAPFDNLVCRYDFLTACRHGILVPPVYRECSLTIDLRDVKLTKQPQGRDYDPIQLREKINGQLHEMCNIARQEMREFGLKRCLFFAPDVGIAKAVEDWYSRGDTGIACRAVYGDLRERDSVIRSYHNGDLDILVSCQMLDVGFDDPPTDGVILATPTKSPVKAFQQGGRGSRLYPGKNRYVCIGYRWDDGREGPQSTLDLLLRGIPDPGVRDAVRDRMLGPRRQNLVEAVEEAELERKKELEAERQRRAGLRFVGSEEDVPYKVWTHEPLPISPVIGLDKPTVRRLVACGKTRQEATVMSEADASAFLDFWEDRHLAGMASAKQVHRLTKGCHPSVAISQKQALALSGKEAGVLIYRLLTTGGIRRGKAVG